VSEPVPPAGFNALTASASQLAEYALPPRPTSLDQLAQWNAEMSRAWYTTPSAFLAEVPAAQQAVPPAAAPGQNTRFGGWETSVGSYTSSSATYIEPTLYGTSCPNPGLAVWSGIGDNIGPFSQDGTTEPGNNGFFQAYDSGVEESTGTLFSIPAGDTVRANVNYKNNETYGTLTNVTIGQVQGWSLPLFDGINPQTVEALVEDVGTENLANFGTLSSTASSGNGNALNTLNVFKQTINQGSASATTNAIGANGSFTVHQTHC
jgi:hypothetical protein